MIEESAATVTRFRVPPLEMEASSAPGMVSYRVISGMSSNRSRPVRGAIWLCFWAGFPGAAATLAFRSLVLQAGLLGWYQVVLIALFGIQMSVVVILIVLQMGLVPFLRWQIKRHGEMGLFADARELYWGSRWGRICLGDVMSLARLRQVVVYAYRDVEEPDAEVSQADLCFAVGDERATYCMLNDFDREPVERFARDLHDRLSHHLAGLRTGQVLDAVAVIQTTAKEACHLRHTLPRLPRRGWARLEFAGAFAAAHVALSKTLALSWSLPVLAGIVALVPMLWLNRTFWGVVDLLLIGLLHLTFIRTAFAGEEVKQP